MTVSVPSLENSLYLNDVQSIIAYTLRKIFRTPKDTVPFLSPAIVSAPYIAAKFSGDIENMVNVLQSEIQNVFNRIFIKERTVTVTVSHKTDSADDQVSTITISVIYTVIDGDRLGSTGTSIKLKDGRFIIPEDNLNFTNDFIQ